MTSALFSVLYLALLAALAFCAASAASEGRAAWSAAGPRARRLALAGVAVSAAAAWLLARDIPVGAGRHNEHALWFLANAPLTSPDLADLFEEREAAPRALFAAYEAVAGRSFGAVLLFQGACWWASALLLFAAVRRLGAGAAGAFVAAALYAANVHAILQARSFAPDVPSAFLVVAGLLAVSGLFVEPGARPAAGRLAWFAAAAWLALMSKFELGLALAAGGALALASRGAALGRRAWVAAAAVGALGAAFLGLGVSVFGKKLLPAEPIGLAELLAAAAANLHRHLAEANLEAVAGWRTPPWATAAAVLALVLAAGWPEKRGDRRAPARALFLGGWLFLLACLYGPFSLYPASHARHHLMVFLPFCALLGLAAGRAFEAAAPRAGRAELSAFLGAVLLVYASAQARAARVYADAPRTHDRELRFLAESRALWPEGCVAVDPEPGLRRRVLAKYFPSRAEGGPEPSCVLVYRRPDVLFRATTPSADLSGLPLTPWRQESFAHAHFTDWHGPWDWDKFERLDAVAVRVAFDRLAAGRWSDLNARLAAAKPRTGAAAPPRWARQHQHPLDRAYQGSVEACYRRALTASLAPAAVPEPARWRLPESAAACFDAAVEDARRRGDAADASQLLSARAAVERALGRDARAREDLRAARRAESGSGRAAFAARGLEGI